MTLLPARVWTQEQWERIKLRCWARSMDEEWDVFVENAIDIHQDQRLVRLHASNVRGPSTF